MEIPFTVRDSETAGVLTHMEIYRGQAEDILIRASYRASEFLSFDEVLVFVENDGSQLELRVSDISEDGYLYLVGHEETDFAKAFGLE